jgi:hypothetical protein
VSDVDAIVFSKDRPLQLDGLLRSIGVYAPGFYSDIAVLWRATTDATTEGYLRLAEEWLGVYFQEQDRFPDEVRDFVEDAYYHVAFLCDDDLYIRPPELEAPGDGVVCWTPRLSPATDWSGNAQAAQGPLGARRWPWRGREYDLGYPFSLDGHVFRVETVRLLLDALGPVDCPNSLEHRAESLIEAGAVAVGEWMTCGERQSLVGIPANRVTGGGYRNPVDPDGLCWRNLAQRFLEGWRLDLEKTVAGIGEPVSPHVWAPLELERC